MQWRTVSRKLTRIKVAGVMNDYLLVTLTLNLTLRSIWVQIQLRQDRLQTWPAKVRSIADSAS